MVLIKEGTPLSWNEAKKLSNYVRLRGIEQFIDIHRQYKDREYKEFKWGDEVEHTLVKFDDKNQKAYLSLCVKKLMDFLKKRELENPSGLKVLWAYEYTSYMIESCPGQPYQGLLDYVNVVEANMKYRRQEIKELLPDDEFILTLSNIPRLGAPKFTWPIYEPKPNSAANHSHSLYFPDEAITPVAWIEAWSKNFIERRGEKINNTTNVFMDKNTKIPVEGAPADKPNAVHIDAAGFGYGCCCVQATFQALNLNEARILHDQLAPLCPIMLALTASTPAFRGYLVDSDCRWNIMRDAGDERTPEERGEEPSDCKIRKYCYDSIDSYLTPNGEKYNDVPLVYDETHYQKLCDGNVDHLLAQYIAQLFLRDPLVLYKENVYDNDDTGRYHHNAVQVMNMRSIRVKPPTENPSIGWRIEFRPCELQLTDFENAAIVCFLTLVTRTILSYKLNFLIPISKVDENMQNAQKRDACRVEKFWFRKNIDDAQNNDSSIDNEYELMTINEIFNGNGSSFPGIIPLVKKYLATLDADNNTLDKAHKYLQFIGGRASGELMTPASWIRKEIVQHPEYKNDSIVTERINYDLLKKINEMQQGTRRCPELHGSLG